MLCLLGKHFADGACQNDDVTIIKWFPCPSFPQTQIQSDQRLVGFQIPLALLGRKTFDAAVFRVKSLFSNPSGVVLRWPKVTAPFNNMRTPKFKPQPTNAFFAIVNQMFGGSFQFPTTAEHCFVVWSVLNDLIPSPSAVVGSWEEPPNIWLTVAKNAFVGWAFNFRVRMLLKGAVIVICP